MGYITITEAQTPISTGHILILPIWRVMKFWLTFFIRIIVIFRLLFFSTIITPAYKSVIVVSWLNYMVLDVDSCCGLAFDFICLISDPHCCILWFRLQNNFIVRLILSFHWHCYPLISWGSMNFAVFKLSNIIVTGCHVCTVVINRVFFLFSDRKIKYISFNLSQAMNFYVDRV